MRIYYTDPACPWSWAAEPALRRIQGEFGDGVSITYVMGGLARVFSEPVATASALVRRAGGEPVDRPDVAGALARWSRLALPEVVEATGLALPRAAAALWELALDFRARPERLGSGYLWAAAMKA